MSPRCVLSVERASFRASAWEPAVLRSSLLAASSSAIASLAALSRPSSSGRRRRMVCSSTRLALSFSCRRPLVPSSSVLISEISTRRLLASTSSRAALSLAFSSADLDPAKLDGELGAKLILVGLDVGGGHWHGHLDPPLGEAHGAPPEGRRDHEGKQARKEKAERRHTCQCRSSEPALPESRRKRRGVARRAMRPALKRAGHFGARAPG